MGPPLQESLSLIEAGRAREALEIADNLQRISREANRFNVGQAQVSMWIRGMAHEALGEPDKAADSYEALLEMIGDGHTDIVGWEDLPERLASQRSAAAAGTTVGTD